MLALVVFGCGLVGSQLCTLIGWMWLNLGWKGTWLIFEMLDTPQSLLHRPLVGVRQS